MVAVDPEAVFNLAQEFYADGFDFYRANYAGSPDTGPLHYETDQALSDLAQACRSIGSSMQVAADTLVTFVNDLAKLDLEIGDLFPGGLVEGIDCDFGPHPIPCPPEPTLPLAPGRRPLPPPYQSNLVTPPPPTQPGHP